MEALVGQQPCKPLYLMRKGCTRREWQGNREATGPMEGGSPSPYPPYCLWWQLATAYH